MPIVLRPPGTRPALTEQLAGLGRTRKRVAVAAGAFALVAAVGGVALAACVLDAAVHLPALARGFALAAALTAGGVVCLGWLASAVRLRTDPLGVALELEDRYPRLNDSLASAVSFLGTDEEAEERGVSSRLTDAAVRRAERLAERHDLGALVPAGRYWRSFWACAAVALAAIPLAVWDTARTETALVRLADPFGAHPWPAKTRIEILAPQALPHRMPRGDAFELRFAVRGVIPDRAAVTFRVAGGGEFEEVYPLAAGADPKDPHAAFVSARLDPGRLTGSFTFRITANDGDTGWQSVAVVPPPRLVPLDGRASPQIRVVPPGYTGLAPADLPDGAAVIEVPTGTFVSLRAAADVRLSSAVLTYLGDRSAVESAAGLAPVGLFNPAGGAGSRLLADAIGADVPVTVSGDGKTMFLSFTPSMSGMYALRMTDETGLPGSRLLEIRLTPDPAPAVSLLRPSPGRDPPLFLPEALVPVHVSADDKVYALRRVFLEYRVGPTGATRTVLLADARLTAAALPAVAGPAGLVHPRPQRFETRLVVPVALFLRDDGTPVRDGDVVFLRAGADDWDDVSVLKDPGRSGEVELRVASREVVEAFLQRELAAVRPDLIRLRDQQRDARQKTGEAVPKDDGTIDPAGREKLLGAEQTQRQIRGKVGDPRDGLRAKAEMLREVARANGLPKSNTTDRVEVLADELGRLADRDLAPIEPLLGDARGLSAQPPKSGQEKVVPGLLARAGRHQKAVEDGLTNLLDLLSQWGGAGEIRGEARVIRDAVSREAANTDRMAERIPPGRAPEKLPPDQRAELDRAAGKLDQLADQSGQLLARAGRLAAEKETQAAEARAAADAKDAEAADLRARAAELPQGSDDRRALDRKADALAAEAADLRAAADKAAAEAEALRRGVEAAGGQALPDELRRAAEALRENRQGEAAALERSAAGRLDRLAEALAEKPDDVPELGRKKQRADTADDIAGRQDDLRRRTEEAARIADPEKREDALKRLAPEQQRLADETRDLVQRLTRERSEGAARDTRAALDRMETARDDLERGQDASQAQREAVERLDDARDRLDNAGAKAADQLTDEKRRKLHDQVKALLERQQAAAAEAARIQEKLLKDKKWSRPLLASAIDLEDGQRALAVEVRTLADREFADLVVFARMLKDAAGGMDKAADRVKTRREDALAADPDAAFDPDLEKANDARVRKPMDLSVRRLEQVLEALKPDDGKKDRPKKEPGKGPGGQPMTPPAGGGNNADVIPPLAQLRALRELQAELNRRTAEFARLHPDPDQLTDEEREELRELEEAQREITTLFEEVAKLFQQPPPDDKVPPEKPAEEKP